MSLADGQYKSASGTKSWGISPGSMVFILPGDQSGSYNPGDDIVSNTGGTAFYGMVVKVTVEASGTSGHQTRLDCADNRIHLQMEPIKMVINMTEVRADDPTTPGIDRQRRYWNIKPSDHANQLKTWYASPYLASQIVTGINDELAFGWSISDPDSLLDRPVYEIDANDGAKVGTVLAKICEQLGILITVTGYNTLLFAQKGSGSTPYIDASARSGWATGGALSQVDTHVEIAGDRNVYQDCQIDLEPWWNSAWETYLREGDWLDQVQSLWGSEWASEATAEIKSARQASKARSVTVRDYVEKSGDNSFADYQWWGEVSRMEIPVWLYLHDIIFRAYRVPRSYVLGALNADSLEMHESLLAAVDYTADTGVISYKRSPAPQFYPQERAFILVKGQPITLIDPRGRKIITPESMAYWRDTWQPRNNFTLDARPESFGVIFDDAIFTDSSAAPLYEFPNRTASGIDATHSLYNVCIPNAAAAPSAASVRAALAWKGDKFLKTFGSGPRWGTAHANGICRHNIVEGGIVTAEVPYADGTSFADDKATEFAASLITQQVSYDAGSITRKGGSGTALNGVTDRVSLTVDIEGGITETVELTKEQMPRNYFNERQLDRLAQMHDQYKDQRANRTDVWNLNEQATQLKELRRRQQSSLHAHGDMRSLLSHPAGVPHSAPVMTNLGETTPEPGQPVWRDAATDAIAADGAVFAGIVIESGARGTAPLATQGTVPVRVKGPFTAGDTVSVTGTDDYAEVGGDRDVGKVQASYTGSDTVLAPVQLGAAAARPAALTYPLIVTDESDADGAKLGVAYGPIAQRDADASMSGGEDMTYVVGDVADGKYLLYCKVPVKFNGKGFWIPDTDNDNGIEHDTELPDPTAELAYCPVAWFTVETITLADSSELKRIKILTSGADSGKADITQCVVGPVSWDRPGDDSEDDGFIDDFSGSAPVPPPP